MPARKPRSPSTAPASARPRRPAGTSDRKTSPPARSRKSDPSTLDITWRDPIAIVALNRPEVHNAFDEQMIAELTSVMRKIDADPAVRAVVLIGAGRSFCAGADLNWMRRMAAYSDAENRADALALANMLAAVNTLRKPVVGRIHGSVFGGGVGLVACCDIAIASTDAVFSLSEARLGLIPATISPYVIEAIGAHACRRLFLTAERIPAAEAYRLGLVHDLVPTEELDAKVNEVLGWLVSGGPQAQAECKELIAAVANRPASPKLLSETAGRIARVRASPEGREGVASFLGKRRPNWVPSS